jgi:hypothetical protein
MLKALFGFSKKNKEIYMHRVKQILEVELNIRTDRSINVNFPHFLAYLDHVEKYFYKKRTPEHCAIGMALIYWESLLLKETSQELAEAKVLAPELELITAKYGRSGALFPELLPRLNDTIDHYRGRYFG